MSMTVAGRHPCIWVWIVRLLVWLVINLWHVHRPIALLVHDYLSSVVLRWAELIMSKAVVLWQNWVHQERWVLSFLGLVYISRHIVRAALLRLRRQWRLLLHWVEFVLLARLLPSMEGHLWVKGELVALDPHDWRLLLLTGRGWIKFIESDGSGITRAQFR